MKIALDTNAYTAFCKGDTVLKAIIEEAETVILPLIVLAELRGGFLCGNRQNENEKHLELFLNAPRVVVRSPDDTTTYLYAQLFQQLRKLGKKIPINDLWIAALVLQENAILVTYDNHFRHIAQLPILPSRV